MNEHHIAIVITPRDNLIKKYGNALAALGKRDAHKALGRAVNRVTDMTYTKVTRALTKQTSAPQKLIRQEVRKQKVNIGHASALEGLISATGSELSLKVFKPKQFKFGVRAKVWGSSQRFDGAFIFAGSYKSGKTVGNGHVFKNTRARNEKSGRDNAVGKMFGPSIPKELIKDESAKAFKDTVHNNLPTRIEHELYRMLGVR